MGEDNLYHHMKGGDKMDYCNIDWNRVSRIMNKPDHGDSTPKRVPISPELESELEEIRSKAAYESSLVSA